MIRMDSSEFLPKINEGLYSRQLYVLGHEAMHKMARAAVLVSGMKGLGVEIAKNLILAGVKSLTIHDQNDAEWSDLSSQFYLSEDDVGQNRAKVSLRHLAKLNSNVDVWYHTNGLYESFLAAFQVVVLTNSPLEEQLQLSDFCHANNICFVVADTKGLAGQLFCDFGENFVVHDPSEAELVSAAIEHITKGNPGLVTVAHDDEQQQGHRFMDGDWVTFSEIEGMTELNGSKPHQISEKGKYSLEVGDTSSFSSYQRGGVITQVKMPQKHSFKSLRVCMADPKIKTTDRSKLFRYRTLHMAFQALHIFQSELGHLPRPQNQADAEKLIELVKTLAVDQELLQEDLIRTFAYGCMGNLSPMNSFIGGLAAQEVLKAVSGKFTPLDQWLYFDAFECLPEEECLGQLTKETCAPSGSRYDGQVAVFGADFQKQLGKQKYFLVGAGAIGCELLKNFAMIGLAAGEGGKITVTDMDIIEMSNLNRQFLFQQQDVSKPKSEVAMTAIKQMNPNITVTAQQNEVGPETEHFYGDDFFLSLDGVASAVDSFEAREYVGKRCFHYCKPLLDSGTQGTMGHTQVFVPFLTEPYGKGHDLDSREYPLCTIRHFPSTIQHTLQWAQDQFDDLFTTAAEKTNEFLMDPTSLETEGMKSLKILNLVKMSLQEKPHCWQDCVAWARRLWERLFCHDILQLLYNFPPEHETSSGLPFWSGSKRCPQHLRFDHNNITHKTFVLSASRLFAQTHKLQVQEDEAVTSQVLLDLHPPPFQPCEEIHIPVTDQEMPTLPDQMMLVEMKQELKMLRQELEKHRTLLSDHMKPLCCEKDENSHLDFIMNAANLRAKNYGIPPVDKFEAKRIVGQIIPAIVTTTAAVAGLACLEIYKLVWQHKHLSSYCNSFLQLSDSLLSRSQPLSSTVYKCHQKTWNCWERITVPAFNTKGEEITLRDICDYIQKEHDLVPTKFLFEMATVYNKEEEIREQQLSFRLTEMIHQITGKSFSKKCHFVVLSMVCENEEEDGDLPPVHVWLQPVNSPK